MTAATPARRHAALGRIGEHVITADEMRAMTAERIERGWLMKRRNRWADVGQAPAG